MDDPFVLDMVRYVHLLTVAIGLGAAFLADFLALKRLNSTITHDMIETLEHYHQVVSFALMGMWVSGIFLIYIRTGFVLENFSPKLLSKLLVVCLLTLNALMIARFALPLAERNIGNRLLELPIANIFTVSAIMGVSTASWLLALALGVSKVLAVSGWPVFVVLIPACYIATLSLAVGVTFMLGTTRLLQSHPRWGGRKA